jgi:hypothetical protein
MIGLSWLTLFQPLKRRLVNLAIGKNWLVEQGRIWPSAWKGCSQSSQGSTLSGREPKNAVALKGPAKVLVRPLVCPCRARALFWVTFRRRCQALPSATMVQTFGQVPAQRRSRQRSRLTKKARARCLFLCHQSLPWANRFQRSAMDPQATAPRYDVLLPAICRGPPACNDGNKTVRKGPKTNRPASCMSGT